MAGKSIASIPIWSDPSATLPIYAKHRKAETSERFKHDRYKSEHIDKKHRNRLLKKLEALQADLHKTMSNFDRFWGFLVESASYLGMCGEKVKPLLDRAAELIEIISKVQGFGENMSSLPMLQQPLLPDSDTVSKPVDPSPG